VVEDGQELNPRKPPATLCAALRNQNVAWEQAFGCRCMFSSFLVNTMKLILCSTGYY
jgi:hypothetical protein